MKSVQVQQRLRPQRHALIVPSGDLSAVARAASINTALWGGVFNPILTGDITEQFHGVLAEFDPDGLLVFDGVSLPDSVEKNFKRRVSKEAEFVKESHRPGKSDLAIGFNITPLLHDIYRNEIRITDAPTNARLIEATGDEKWSAFVTVLFGSFSHLPNMDRDYESAFKDSLRAEVIGFDERTPTDAVVNIVSPISFTQQRLHVYGGSASISSHVLFVGDRTNPDDLISFWNLRATGRRVWFIPTDSYQLHGSMVREILRSGRYAINPEVENQADMQKGPSISEEAAHQIQAWIIDLGEGAASIRMWQPGYGHSIPMYVGDIHVAEIEADKRQDIAHVEGETNTWVNPISPQILADEPGLHGLNWAIELSFIGGDFENATTLNLPRSPSVERLMQRETGQLQARVGERGLVVLQSDMSSTLRFSPIPTAKVFRAIFEDAGLDAVASDPGIYAEQIINKMGHLQFDCRVFKIRGVREIIKRLSSGESLDRAAMKQIVMSEEDDGHGKNWREDLYSKMVIRRGQQGKLGFAEIFEELLDNQVIRPGLRLRCQKCRQEDWYHVSEFSEEFTCRLCFSRERVPFSHPTVKQWQFRSDGFFRIPDSARGSLSVIVSLWRFAQLATLDRGKYVASTKLARKKGGGEFEIDYAYLRLNPMKSTRFQLVLGEAKGFRPLENSDVDKMCELAKEFDSAPFLAFSTLKEEFSASERDLLKAAVEDGYKVIALTREELDPYDLHDRFESSPHKYAVSLQDLSENTIYLNINT